jgi:malate dehydrogenase (oxaloacetate-decarboxylating)(NADP+)
MSNNDELKQAALDYHRTLPRGKIKVVPTKPMVTQRDLALAYSPGVAYACEAIVDDPNAASELTARGNLVAVITNGTAVLGLGDIGPLAGKAGDGRQGHPVPEVRRHRRVRHRDRRARP